MAVSGHPWPKFVPVAPSNHCPAREDFSFAHLFPGLPSSAPSTFFLGRDYATGAKGPLKHGKQSGTPENLPREGLFRNSAMNYQNTLQLVTFVLRNIVRRRAKPYFGRSVRRRSSERFFSEFEVSITEARMKVVHYRALRKRATKEGKREIRVTYTST